MKQLLSLFLFLLPCLAWAQYPSNGNQKITLGEQTTADGLIWRGIAADTTTTVKSDTAAYFVLDTVNINLYTYKASATGQKWRQLGADTASIAYVNTYGTQTVNGVKTFTDTIIVNKGIRFPATQSASTNLNTLDDYEEGTWTTTFGAQSNLTGTPVLANAIYRKIGQLVYLEGRINGLTITTANTNTFLILSVPINMNANTTNQVGNVYTFTSTSDIIGVITDNTGSENTTLAIFFPKSLVTAGSLFAILFSVTYVANN
jgi:hypothetical protein